MEVYAGSRDQWTTSLVERCFIIHMDGDRSRWHGALEIRSLMCDDGLALEVDAV